MADDFRTFDKEPIVPVFKISRWSFGLREIILILIVALLLVLCLVFAGLYGNAKEKLADMPTASAIVGEHYCTDLGCLKTAARAVSFINRSVDPCENFYQFACGNYKNARRVLPNEGSRTVLQELKDKNNDLIIDILEQPISAQQDWAAEKKLKKFFESCNDMYVREKQKGLPLLTKVIPELGGWKLLGTWDAGRWDLNAALEKVQSDFLVNALYQHMLHMDREVEGKRIIALNSAGTGKYMEPLWYHNPSFASVVKDYKKFIRRVASFLARDASTLLNPPQGNAALLEDLLDEFVNDSFTIEYQIASLNSFGFNPDYRSEIRFDRMTVDSLTRLTGNVIDYKRQLSYLFNRTGVSGDSVVEVLNKRYFTGLSSYLSSLPEEDMKRMVHNYLIWRVAESYVQEMSWEYIHANREVYVDLRGRSDFQSVYNYCFQQSEHYMADALNYLYISQFSSKQNRETAHAIGDSIRLALRSQISSTPWMDQSTRKYAQEKLDLIVFRMGFPPWMANQGVIDDMYSSLTVNVSDFFGNVLRMNQLQRSIRNAELQRHTIERSKWHFKVYDTSVTFSIRWNEVAASAGILQFPIYDDEQPHFSSFGSLGYEIGWQVHSFVDETGQIFDKNGEWMNPDKGKGTWWSDVSVAQYKKVKQCVKDVYSNLTRTLKAPDGSWKKVTIDASSMAAYSISRINGVRLALLGYHDWAQAKGLEEKTIPGLDMTNQQMVFLAHAQTMCEVEDQHSSYIAALQGRMNQEMATNMALGQLPEFSEAFQCKKDAKMNHNKKCQYY